MMSVVTPYHDVDPRGREAIVTDGGGGASRSALACVRALAEGGLRPLVAVPEGGDELAAASRWAVRFEVPDLADTERYRRAIRQAADDKRCAVFATSDRAMVAIGASGAALTDKTVLGRRATEVGIDVPESTIIAAMSELPATAAFPLVVKPVFGSAPAVRLDDVSDADRLSDDDGPFVVQPFIDEEMTAIGGVVWDGALIAAVHQRYERRWPIDCGTASAAITVEHDVVREASLVSLLDDHRGVFQAQYLGGRLIDLNPRPYGSLPLATKSGVNLPALVCALNAGEHPATGTVRRARVGVRYRWLEGDVRHVAARLRNGSMRPIDAVRALAPCRGTAHSVVSLRDPLPALVRGRQVVRQAWRRSAT
jgi:predicted ATP-grasp superfamily ATP-dependent carboligase